MNPATKKQPTASPVRDKIVAPKKFSTFNLPLPATKVKTPAVTVATDTPARVAISAITASQSLAFPFASAADIVFIQSKDLLCVN